MNRILFEGRLLVSMAASVARQDDLRPLHGKLDWERMFRIADYNRIADLIYVAVLGNEKVPQQWRDRFFERYQESLRFGDICTEGEQEFLALLESREISALIVGSSSRRLLYEMPEMAGVCSLCLYMNTENYVLAKGYLIDLGYETDRAYGVYGERLRRPDGFSVELYDGIPYKTPFYHKQLSRLLDRGETAAPYTHIRILSPSDRLIWLFAQAAYLYATDQLLVRHLMDLCVLHRSLAETPEMERIWQRLKGLKIGSLCEKLLGLGYMWFGTKEERAVSPSQDELEVYDVIENRILGYGKEYPETMPEALALTGSILKAEERENRHARRKLLYRRFMDDCNELYSLFRKKDQQDSLK